MNVDFPPIFLPINLIRTNIFPTAIQKDLNKNREKFVWNSKLENDPDPIKQLDNISLDIFSGLCSAICLACGRRLRGSRDTNEAIPSQHTERRNSQHIFPSGFCLVHWKSRECVVHPNGIINHIVPLLTYFLSRSKSHVIH